jgi:hypothetical protein
MSTLASPISCRILRRTQDGRVLAYDAKTEDSLWETAIGYPNKHESTPVTAGTVRRRRNRPDGNSLADGNHNGEGIDTRPLE